MSSIHIAINGWFTGNRGAGSGQYLEQLLPALVARAPHIRWSLLLPDAAHTSDFAGVEIVRAKTPSLPRSLRKLWWEQVTVPKMTQALGADLLWVPYWAAPWRQPVPTIVTIHDLIPLLLPAYRGGLLNRGYTALVAATARRAQAVITVSHASKRDIIEHLRIAEARVHVVWHGPNQESAVSADISGDTSADIIADIATVRARYHLPARYFLYLGGFDVRKNLEGILSGYRRYLDKGGDASIKLVIAGKMPEHNSAFAPDPRAIAALLEITPHVHYTGWIDEAHKPALYAAATAYLFPSQYEGFGMMLLEAMQAGAPVITSR